MLDPRLLAAASVLIAAASQGTEDRVVALPVDGARDVTDEGLAFVEVLAPREAYFVHEPIRLRLRFGFERGFLEGSAVQPFGRPLDFPAQVQAPWIESLPGAIAMPRDGEGAGLTFALNERVVRATRAADRVAGGRTFTVLEIETRWLPAHPGELVVSAPVLRFAYATRFEDDFVHGRVAADRRDAFVRGAPLVLAIRALPETGRPPEFSGAVGRFSVRAEAVPRELDAGESLQLVLRFECEDGAGSLASFDPPRLDRLAGFHLRGQTDETIGAARVVAYDLAPTRAQVREIPSIAFAWFDPAPPGAYRTARTEPIPLAVRPAPAGAPAESAPTRKPLEPAASRTTVLLLTAALLWVGIILWRRARRTRETS